jgi:hypothetical protein
MSNADQPREPTTAQAVESGGGRYFSAQQLTYAAAGVVVGAALVLAVSCVVAGWLRPSNELGDRDGGGGGSSDKDPKKRLFVDWPKPDLVLLLSGQQHGYLLPCGCSSPQVGGLERRYNFVQWLKKDKGWPVLGVDVGDVPQRRGPRDLPNVQGLIKYAYSMRALKQIGYKAVTVGEYEGAMPLSAPLAEYALSELVPRVLVANLKDRDDLYPEQQEDCIVEHVKEAKLNIGIVGVVGPSVAAKIKDPRAEFPDGSVAKVLPVILKKMDAGKVKPAEAKPDLRVLLYQGTPKEAAACAKAFPSQFQVILCLCEADEPPGKAEKEGETLIICVGHKGKYVGAVGINRTGKDKPKFELRYQLVSMGEEFKTPEGKEKDQPILKLLEAYTRELKEGVNGKPYLAMYGQSKHPSQVGLDADKMPTYVGSERCKNCHRHAYDIWKKSEHSHAYDALVAGARPDSAKNPSLRQYDPECIVCHTVGFGYVSGFKNETDSPKLKHVGCESCHGPASLHVKNENNVAAREALNAWKVKGKEDAEAKKARMMRIEIQLCIKCHDQENDVHWKFDKWFAGGEKKHKIEHNTPKD